MAEISHANSKAGKIMDTPANGEMQRASKNSTFPEAPESAKFPLQGTLMGAEGLEPFSPNMEKQGGNTGRTEPSEIGGTPGGTVEENSDSAAGLRQQALDDLQRAWKALRRLEDLADDPTEAEAAGRAVAFVDMAFAELETT